MPTLLNPVDRLDAREIDLLSELLECEEKKLTVEIRHTDTAEFRALLHRRLEAIGRILGKLRSPSAEQGPLTR
jgi:hypothetical protein